MDILLFIILAGAAAFVAIKYFRPRLDAQDRASQQRSNQQPSTQDRASQQPSPQQRANQQPSPQRRSNQQLSTQRRASQQPSSQRRSKQQPRTQRRASQRPVRSGAAVKRIPEFQTYSGERTPASKRIITEQVYDVAEHLIKGNVEFDEKNANWAIFPEYHLPKRLWKQHTAGKIPLKIVFPIEYPLLPPVGFYLKISLKSGLRSAGHVYQAAYHQADPSHIGGGWHWYCVYVEKGSWKPAPAKWGDWKYGDDLWTYVRLINEVLESPE